MKKCLNLLILFFCIVLVCSCNNKKLKGKDNDIKREILNNMQMIIQTSNPTISNPYDYIKNKYYNNIIKIKDDAVPILISLFESNELDSLTGYIAALAIQDITDCNLYENYNLNFETAGEFFKLWKSNNCSYN